MYGCDDWRLASHFFSRERIFEFITLMSLSSFEIFLLLSRARYVGFSIWVELEQGMPCYVEINWSFKTSLTWAQYRIGSTQIDSSSRLLDRKLISIEMCLHHRIPTCWPAFYISNLRQFRILEAVDPTNALSIPPKHQIKVHTRTLQ